MKQIFHSNGKLLLTGEYVVLDGAMALAIPTKLGQSLKVENISEKVIQWKSLDLHGNIWFETVFSLDIFQKENIQENSQNKVRDTLIKLLREAKKLNPVFLNDLQGFKITTNLEFPRNWGLGTSSTLINNIAQWAQVDAFKLLRTGFGGSGYDIAAAQNDKPIFFNNPLEPQIRHVHLDWDFKDQLFFVYLNKKQDSKKAIAHYKKKEIDQKTIDRISDISKKLLMCYTLSDFEKLMNAHEALISEILKMPPLKESAFKDFNGTVKSLGAWGGDFILATGTDGKMDYFRRKGYNTIVPFEKMMK